MLPHLLAGWKRTEQRSNGLSSDLRSSWPSLTQSSPMHHRLHLTSICRASTHMHTHTDTHSSSFIIKTKMKWKQQSHKLTFCLHKPEAHVLLIEKQETNCFPIWLKILGAWSWSHPMCQAGKWGCPQKRCSIFGADLIYVGSGQLFLSNNYAPGHLLLSLMMNLITLASPHIHLLLYFAF